MNLTLSPVNLFQRSILTAGCHQLMTLKCSSLRMSPPPPPPFLFPAPLPRKRKLDHNFNLVILIFQYKQKQEKKTHASVTRLYWLKVFMSIFHSSINQEHISPFPWLYWSEVVAHLSITVTSGRLEPIEHYKLK